MTRPPDDRLALARAYARASLVVSIALEMVIPGLLGYAIDHWLGTRAVFMVLGFAVGLSYGIWQLVRLGASDSGPPDNGSGDAGEQHGEARRSSDTEDERR